MYVSLACDTVIITRIMYLRPHNNYFLCLIYQRNFLKCLSMVCTLLVTTQECATMQVLAKGYHMYNCDWLWEKPHLAMHEGNY